MPDSKQKSQCKIQDHKNPETAIVIVAAGKGMRAGGTVPKQYQFLASKPLLFHTLRSVSSTFQGVPIALVINPNDADLYDPIIAMFENIFLVCGGKTRQESVFNGLKALEVCSPKHVLVHDAARPFVTKALASNIQKSLDMGHTAVIPALAVTDTLKRVKEGIIEETVSRELLYSVQTPQAFDYALLLEAHNAAKHSNYTDDGAVFEANGGQVHICDGEEGNFKVTRPEDFKKAEDRLLFACPDIRVGSGYDVHAFEEGDHVILCGVKIPHSYKLKGHSDADVAMHAITDALFASISAGDIGTHFPPSDSKWRGAASDIFLKHAGDLIAQKGGIISHVGVTIICEKPKIGPHVIAMQEKLANCLGISTDRVSVQATTTEKLGFTGREEGIAAQATATVRLPLE